MSEKSKKIIEENIKLHMSEAYFYEILHPSIFNILEQRRLHAEIRKLRANFPPYVEPLCLDIGSGTGNLVRVLNRAGFDDVVAVDISRHMLEQNNAKHKILCNASHLPFKSRIFSLVTTYSVFHHLPDVDGFLNEVCRCTAPTAILYFDHDPFIKVTNKKLNRVIQKYAYLIWLLRNPSFLKRLLEYLLSGRKKHRQNIKGLNAELIEKNVFEVADVVTKLKANKSEIQIVSYFTSSYLKASRFTKTL
jgi:ubiquinone/menaquinone biosynthesis C-methylase UbiE